MRSLTAHAALVFVVEREPEQITEGRERALRSVRLGLFERALMGLAQRRSHAVADAATLARDDDVAGAHPDADPGGVGADPRISPAVLPDALAPDDLSV